MRHNMKNIYYISQFLSEGYPFYLTSVFDVNGVVTSNFTSTQNIVAAKRFDYYSVAQLELSKYLEGKVEIKKKFILTVEEV